MPVGANQTQAPVYKLTPVDQITPSAHFAGEKQACLSLSNCFQGYSFCSRAQSKQCPMAKGRAGTLHHHWLSLAATSAPVSWSCTPLPLLKDTPLLHRQVDILVISGWNLMLLLSTEEIIQLILSLLPASSCCYISCAIFTCTSAALVLEWKYLTLNSQRKAI